MHYFACYGCPRLNTTFNHGVETGVTRFEFTIYTRQLPGFAELRDYTDVQLHSLFESKAFYQVPLRDQWMHILSKIKSSVIIHYENSDPPALITLLTQNSLTKRFLGCKERLSSLPEQQSLKIHYALNYLTFPSTVVNYLNVQFTRDNLIIKHSKFERLAETTYNISNPSKTMFTVAKPAQQQKLLIQSIFGN